MPPKMRLSKDLIQHIAAAISANLESKGLAKYDVPRDAVTAKITDIITT
ncbi:MAG: hypothetical protein H6R44_552, partial [Nitrospirae bacterium]|nr:hypothetical protein [Nitrospirota bacterium]